MVNPTSLQETGGNNILLSFLKLYAKLLWQDLLSLDFFFLTMEFQGDFPTNVTTTASGVTFNVTETQPTPESLAFKTFKLFCYSLVFLLGVIGNVLVFAWS